MSGHKILRIAASETNLRDKLSQELGISTILAQVLINRKIDTMSLAQEFLTSGPRQFLDPHTFCDMSKAIALIKGAASSGKKVMLFGDYDADGITAVALLKESFKKIGLAPSHYLPHRVKEGYGLNSNAVQCAIKEKVQLLVTCDCGISSHAEIKELRRNNIEVIVTDHHESAGADLPPASAIINPKVKDCGYKFRDLAGVGVAFKLCQALCNSRLLEELDLVALGTIADSVPLVGENRVIAKEGLKKLEKTERFGIKALIESAGINGRRFNTEFVSFILAPRINAGGRMDSAEISLELLLSRTEAEAGVLAQSLETHNRQRQKIEGQIMAEAEELISRDFDCKTHKAIVVAKDGWHRGVLGIVASKLADRFYRPTIVISMDGALCKGSGRSIKNFHLFEALVECRKSLSAFGGHSHAVGLVVERDKIAEFRDNIISFAGEKMRLEDLLPSLDIDLELGLGELSPELAVELLRLEPFGEGNPEPLFYTKGLKLKGRPQLLRRDTLKFMVSDGISNMQAIGFGMGSYLSSLEAADSLDLVYSARVDNWQGASSLILEAKDIFFK